ncbi:triphosphoribosyl-dephospho-CoA synthase CitG [Selenomonas sp. F0473]|uniref:triphosphoribosyl-dephospho-CoA synthase CitG n=1 Tax=Selenomonas sp. F0473 TaxID=999423 RepID=UPI0025FD8726|nr:triphosphoribosyl-dephospho-CoA synthase CitG [Selenomonas sp. F0473]
MCNADRIASYAVEALLVEAAATPKPGLVDRANNGAHEDMDFFTFQKSAAALAPYFTEFVRAGAGEGRSLYTLLSELRPIGRAAESAMYARTGGVNTHKGAIFSFGVLLGAAGWISAHGKPLMADAVLNAVRIICAGLCHTDYGGQFDTPQTKGQAAYLTYGLTGVRGEAEAGFPLVWDYALPLYRVRRAEHAPLNDALVDVLLVLMAHNMDTNVLGRHDLAMLQRVQEEADQIAKLGGMRTERGRAALQAFDAQLIDAWVSPGGSADLAAVTHFLYEIESMEV